MLGKDAQFWPPGMPGLQRHTLRGGQGCWRCCLLCKNQPNLLPLFSLQTLDARDMPSILQPCMNRPPLLCMPAQNCGLVVEAHIIDERSEWRTFSDKVCMGCDEEGAQRYRTCLLHGNLLCMQEHAPPWKFFDPQQEARVLTMRHQNGRN